MYNKGIGQAKAVKIKAALELSKRIIEDYHKGKIIVKKCSI